MMTTYLQNWAFVFKQNAEQLSRWLWREPLTLTGVIQLFMVLVLSLVIEVASAGTDCYTPSPSDWQFKYQYAYKLQADYNRVHIGHISVQVTSGSMVFKEAGNIQVLVNKNPVNLYTDRDAQNFVGKKFSYDAPTLPDRGNIDLWFNTYLNPPTDDLTVELRHQTGTSWTVSWAMEVSCPITVPDPPVPDDPVTPGPLESPRNVSATDGQYSDYIEVTWDVVDNATKYEIWRGTSVSNMKKINIDSEDRYLDTTVQKGVTYYYAVKAINDSQKSNLSDYDSGYLKEEPPEDPPVEPPPLPKKFQLVVNKSGNGSVDISPFGNHCGDNCYAYNKDAFVILTATPSSNSEFQEWQNCDNPTGNQCHITMNGDKSVTAVFNQIEYPELKVSYSGNGSVEVFPLGNHCGDNCYAYDKGASVTLTAKPSDGYKFSSWSGCNSNSTQCTLSMTDDQHVTASFVQIPKYSLIVSIQGNGSGTVTGPNLNCSNNTCTGSYLEDTPVTLNANPLEGSTFGGWQGACSGTNECSIFMTTSQAVTATFNNEPPIITLISPPDDVEDQELDITLNWKATDPEDGVIKVYEKAFFKEKDSQFNQMTCTQNPSGGKSGSEAHFTCQPPQALEYNTPYVWAVTVTDQGGLSTKAEWSFKTRANRPPSRPEISSPAHGATDIDPNQDISLNCKASTDDESDAITYSFYFGDDLTQLQLVENCTGSSPGPCIIPIAKLETGKIYFWQCAARDEDNPPQRGVPWQFTTPANQPPYKVSAPVLKNGDKIIDPVVDWVDSKISLELSWQGNGDPENDEVSYRACYVNLADIDDLNDISGDGCRPVSDYRPEMSGTIKAETLEPDASYAWIVSAKDSHGNPSKWDIWTFKTKPAPPSIELTANSGDKHTALDWTSSSSELFKIVEYRILRVLHPKDSHTAPAFNPTRDEIARTRDLVYTDIEKGVDKEQYCYRVDGLDVNGKLVASSTYNKDTTCITYGEVTLVIDSVSAVKKGDVPIRMPNGGGLKIRAGDLCIQYDSKVLTVTGVKTQAFSEGFVFKYELNKYPGIVKIKIEPEPKSGFGEPVLMGPGHLAEISFEAKEDRPSDYSDLEWFEAADDEDLVRQYPVLEGCISIFDDQGERVELLGLRDGDFLVRKGLRSARDGQRTTARFYVRKPYSKGDLDGDGIVTTGGDVMQAVGIGLGFYDHAMQEQLNAGDSNGDNRIDEADARVIAHYVLHQEWLDDDLPTTEGLKTDLVLREGQRDGKNPIVISMDEVSGMLGSEVTVPLSVADLVDLTAMNLTIAYNKAVIEKIVVNKVGITSDASLNFYDNKEGIIRIAISSDIPLSGNGEIATLTLHLVANGTVKSSPLAIAKTNLYDRYGRNFVTSTLQYQIAKQNGKVIIEDVVEEPVIEDEVIPIRDMMPNPSTTGTHSATCQINDHSGNPIAGATVTIGNKTVITDEYGYCAIVGLTEGEYTMTVSKDGYIFLDEPCKIGDEDYCHLNLMNLNVGMAAPALCQIYAVNDKAVKDSQLFTVSLDDFSITELGEYPKYDLEALDIDPRTDIIYLAAGDSAQPDKKGYLYVLDGETGELFPVGNTGFTEIEDLAFSSDGTLWAWAKGDGLITIDLLSGQGTLVYPSEWDVEGLTIQEDENGHLVFYAAIDTELWFYDTSTETFDIACIDLPGETEALEMIPGNLILIGVHNDQALKLHALEPNTCEEVADADIPIPQFDDIEGIALPTKACIK